MTTNYEKIISNKCPNCNGILKNIQDLNKYKKQCTKCLIVYYHPDDMGAGVWFNQGVQIPQINNMPLSIEVLTYFGFTIEPYLAYNGLRLSVQFYRWDPENHMLQIDSLFGSTELYYVHQLQNWFFGLTGQELK